MYIEDSHVTRQFQYDIFIVIRSERIQAEKENAYIFENT